MSLRHLDPYLRYFEMSDSYHCTKMTVYADDYRLFLGILDGCRLITESRTLELNDGCFAIIPPKTFYRLERHKDSELLIMNFDMDQSHSQSDCIAPFPENNFRQESEFSLLAPKPFDKLIYCSDPSVKDALIAIYKEYLLKAPFYNELISAEFKALLIRIARTHFSETHYPNYLEGVLRYIDECFPHAPSNRELAERFGFNGNYLSNVFKEHLGVSMHAYISNKRATYAQQLLVSTDMSVCRIAEETGFSSQNRFTEFFKNKFNISPLKYRQLMQGK